MVDKAPPTPEEQKKIQKERKEFMEKSLTTRKFVVEMVYKEGEYLPDYTSHYFYPIEQIAIKVENEKDFLDARKEILYMLSKFKK